MQRAGNIAYNLFNVVVLCIAASLALASSGCGSSLQQTHETAVNHAIAATNGTGFTVLQIRQQERLACVDDNDTREAAEACIAKVDAKFVDALEAIYYFDQVLTAYGNAVKLLDDGELTVTDMLRFAGECVKAYDALQKALKPIGVDLPELPLPGGVSAEASTG